VSKLTIVVLVALVTGLIVLSSVGGAWKWRGPRAAAQHQVAFGWTWDARTSHGHPHQ
jgi:hypothetical protein